MLVFIQSAMVACGPKGNINSSFAIGQTDKSRLQLLDSLVKFHYAMNTDSTVLYLQKKIDLLDSLKQYGTMAEMYLYHLTEIYQYRKFDGENALSSIAAAVHVFLDNPELKIPNIYIFINLGNVLMSNNLDEEAIFAYQEAISINNDQPYIWVLAMNNIALCYQKQQLYDSASHYFRLANKTIPDKKDIMMIQNYNYINALILEKGEIDSIKFYHELVENVVPQIDIKKFETDKIAFENAKLEVSKILAQTDFLMARYFRLVQDNNKADSCFRRALNHIKSPGLDRFRAEVYLNLRLGPIAC